MGRRVGHGNGDVAVEVGKGFVGGKLIGVDVVVVLHMGGLETDGQMKRGVLVAAFQKLNGLVAHLGCEVLTLLLFHVPFEVAALTREAVIIIEDTVRLLGMADAPLANKARAITCGLELTQIGVVQGFLREVRIERPDAVPGGVLSGEYTSAVGHADGGGDKGIFEQRTLRGHLVDVGRVDDLVAHAAECVSPLVVRHEVDDVGPLGSR